MAAFSRLLPVAVGAVGLQAGASSCSYTLLSVSLTRMPAAGAAAFVPLATEMYFDLWGSLGYLSTAFVSLYYPALRTKTQHLLGNGANAPLPPLSSFAPRQLLLTACLSVWATRMGIFLFDVRRALSLSILAPRPANTRPASTESWRRLSFRQDPTPSRTIRHVLGRPGCV
jgi:hypothetical protein